VIPAGIVSTAWPRIEAKCAELGVTFDTWQQGVGSIALGKRKDGKYAATVGGVVLSIPRQVGKTFLVGMIVIALCLLVPGLTILWTAHRTRTATKTFHTLKGMTERPKVKPHMLDPRLSNGEQEIRFRNGSVIMFGAREQGFGRGFDEIDVEVFDEAQILSEKALEDMVPATNQSRQGTGALLFFMGTPPRPGDPGDEFTNRRNRAISGKSDSMVYVEFSADDEAKLDDRDQWRKANPSYPHRTSDESMMRMRENLTDDDSFRREALGIWPDATVSGVVPAATWSTLADPDAAPPSSPVFAVDVAPDRSSTCISTAGHRDDGKVQLATVEHKSGTGWVVDRLKALCEAHGGEVVIDPGGAAGSLIAELERADVPLRLMRTRDVVQAFGMFVDACANDGLRHLGQPSLTSALAGAKKRDLTGGGSAWARQSVAVDITPLVAATNALWGVGTAETTADPDIYFL
jgi:hypothetical protein